MSSSPPTGAADAGRFAAAPRRRDVVAALPRADDPGALGPGDPVTDFDLPLLGGSGRPPRRLRRSGRSRSSSAPTPDRPSAASWASWRSCTSGIASGWRSSSTSGRRIPRTAGCWRSTAKPASCSSTPSRSTRPRSAATPAPCGWRRGSRSWSTTSTTRSRPPTAAGPTAWSWSGATAASPSSASQAGRLPPAALAAAIETGAC